MEIARLALLASAPERVLALASISCPKGSPEKVEGQTLTRSLRAIRLNFPDSRHVRIRSRPSSTVMLTGVVTGEPSVLKVVRATVRAPSNQPDPDVLV